MKGGDNMTDLDTATLVLVAVGALAVVVKARDRFLEFWKRHR